MASDDKKIKTNPAPKTEAAPEKSASGAEPSKAEGGETATVPSGYSRGEGQKPVSKAYRDNWNVIFAKKKSDNSRDGAAAAFISISQHCTVVGRPVVKYIQRRK